MKIKILLSTIFISHIIFAAQGLKSEDSKILAKELADTVNLSLIEIQKIENQYNNSVSLEGFSISNQDASGASLGLLIDSDDNSVLAVTPNLMANEMGVTVGDKIVDIAIDGVNISPFSDAFVPAMNEGRELLINLERNGSELKLVSDIGFLNNPEWILSVTKSNHDDSIHLSNQNSGECGYISQLSFSLRTKYLFATRIISIDKNQENYRRPKRLSPRTYRLPPGKYTIRLHEAIDDKNLLKFESKTERRNYKSFDLIVEANKSHTIAAKYLKKGERSDERQKNYWEPVVYKTKDRKCSL